VAAAEVISVASRRFWDLFQALPPDIQKRAVKNYRLWQRDHHHPSLHFRRWAAPIVLSDSEPHDDRYAAVISSRLKERGIVTAHRSGSVRTSPHFYISPGEIDRMISELP
jgi:hypothetical protein